MIKILIAVHGRHEVVKLFAKYCRYEVIAVASTVEDIELCKSLGWTVFEYSNDHLGRKLQYCLNQSIGLEWDNILMVGSDDLISNSLKWMYDYLAPTTDFIALDACYMFDMKTKRSRIWNGYNNARKGEPCGAGRMYSRSLLEKIDFKLWDESPQRGVDGYSWKQITKYKRPLVLSGSEFMLVDLKDNDSTTKYETFSKYPRVDSSLIINEFPELGK